MGDREDEFAAEGIRVVGYEETKVSKVCTLSCLHYPPNEATTKSFTNRVPRS